MQKLSLTSAVTAALGIAALTFVTHGVQAGPNDSQVFAQERYAQAQDKKDSAPKKDDSKDSKDGNKMWGG